ncbi:mediator of RNA polymerase II transcription subunit 16 [Condylostylus longicornis]|uniref:mediator of RNA polymerase II transcription subunit 16 n=1 Tax=Condylostylus longicornis TaxID=2530218 RepID=UPI00244E0892|nr:mediator of RNA polymerase II transcription subunit 16 [Condylostylus longicornis]XP_055378585.1 mediator of RNA polymerase II transcription subunit 16 [Condylostylus longicornis]
MEVLYSVRKKWMPANVSPLLNCISISKLSSKNILAFTSQHDLQATSESNINKSINNQMISGSIVYVCDITAPFYVFRVTETRKTTITVLEWDVASKNLLLGDSEGNIQIWTQKTNLLSEWHQVYVVKLPSEKIVKAAFFHNGRKLNFASEKRDMVYYMEKFQRAKFSPSVRQFGGVAAEGCIVITSTGLIGAFLLPGQCISPTNHQSQQQQQNVFQGPVNNMQLPIILKPVTQSLGLIRSHITTASIAFGTNDYSDGHFRVAVANSETNKQNMQLMVQSYRVTLKIIDHGNLLINSHALPSFFLLEGSGRDLLDMKITHLCWTSSEDIDSLIVATKTMNGSFIELWSLVEKVTPIHKLLQTNKTEIYKTVAWTNQHSFRYPSSIVVDIAVSKILFDNSYIFLAMEDNTVHILTKDLKKITSTTVTTSYAFESGSGTPKPKIQRAGGTLMSMDVTFFGHLLLVVDSHSQIHAIRLPQHYHEQNSIVLSHLVSLFEYSIVSGIDASDLLVSVRSNLLENIIEKLTENFTRQSSSIQQYYYVNFLTVKINLYRMQITGQSKANDLTSLLMLHSILIAFKSLLRPSDLSSHDKGPAENLAMVLSDSQLDIDKVLTNLHAKDFTVESFTVQSLQQLIQWVSDLALNILAKLPQNYNQGPSSKNCGYDISKDIVALNSIRELLVMIRIWGLLNSQCLPVFSRSVENLDILSTLFRLLTRLALNPSEPDEVLLDECCLLPSQVLIPQIQHNSPIVSISSPVLHLNSLPLLLFYNIEPDFLTFHQDIQPIEGGLVNDGYIDSVRNLWLGKKPSTLRKCLRCGACSIFGSVAKTAAMKAWEQRWVNNCRCGGYWILQKSAKT